MEESREQKVAKIKAEISNLNERIEFVEAELAAGELIPVDKRQASHETWKADLTAKLTQFRAELETQRELELLETFQSAEQKISRLETENKALEKRIEELGSDNNKDPEIQAELAKGVVANKLKIAEIQRIAVIQPVLPAAAAAAVVPPVSLPPASPTNSPKKESGFLAKLFGRNKTESATIAAVAPASAAPSPAVASVIPPETMTISDAENKTPDVTVAFFTKEILPLLEQDKYFALERKDDGCFLRSPSGTLIELHLHTVGDTKGPHIVYRAGNNLLDTAALARESIKIEQTLQLLCAGIRFNPTTLRFRPNDALPQDAKTRLLGQFAQIPHNLMTQDFFRTQEAARLAKAAANTKARAAKAAPAPAATAPKAAAPKTSAAPAATTAVPPAVPPVIPVVPPAAAAPAQRPKQAVINKATAYYTNDFKLMYVQVGNDFYKNQTPDVYNNLEKLSKKPDTTNLQNKPFPIADATNIEQIEVEVTQFLDEQSRAAAAAPKTSTAPAPAPASPTTTSTGTGDDATFDAGDVSISADPAAAKRATPTDHKVYTFLKDPAMIARVNAAVKPLSYTLAADGTTMTKSYGDRQITINENGGMSSNPITTGRTEKVAAILANDLIAIFRTYAILYQKGKDAALPDGIINLRLNAKGLSFAQERAHILLTHDVKERFYAELKKNPNSYPEAFLKKFKFDGEEIRVDLKRKAAVAPDATPDAKKPAAAPAPAATSKYLSGVISNLEKDPNDKAAKDLLISILNGTNSLLAAEGNVVKPKTAPTSPEESEALQKALGLLQEVLSKSGYEKATMNVTADSMSLPKSGKDMAAEIKASAVRSAPSPRMGRRE